MMLLELAAFAYTPLSEILHRHDMAKLVAKQPIASPPPYPINPGKYPGLNGFGQDMTLSTIREQRLSGVSAAVWGNTSGIL